MVGRGPSSKSPSGVGYVCRKEWLAFHSSADIHSTENLLHYLSAENSVRWECSEELDVCLWKYKERLSLTVARQGDVWTQKVSKSNPKPQGKVCHTLAQILKNPRRHRRIWNAVVPVAPFEEGMLEVWVLDGGNKWRDMCITQAYPTLCDPMDYTPL